MLNEALLLEKPTYNAFTSEIKKRCADGTPVMVRMRNGTWVEVIFSPANPDDHRDDDQFQAKDRRMSLIWCLDGSSITSDRFDLIEIR